MTQTSFSALLDTLVMMVVLLAGESKNHIPEFIAISIGRISLKKVYSYNMVSVNYSIFELFF